MRQKTLPVCFILRLNWLRLLLDRLSRFITSILLVFLSALSGVIFLLSFNAIKKEVYQLLIFRGKNLTHQEGIFDLNFLVVSLIFKLNDVVYHLPVPLGLCHYKFSELLGTACLQFR